MSQCAFGPHAAVVAFQGEEGQRLSDAWVEMSHCTALLSNESAICRLDRTNRCCLKVDHCLFSQPEQALHEDAAVLVRQSQEGPAEGLCFLGEDNRYHNLSAFWASPAFQPVAQTLRRIPQGDPVVLGQR